jgi:hypothetical protein
MIRRRDHPSAIRPSAVQGPHIVSDRASGVWAGVLLLAAWSAGAADAQSIQRFEARVDRAQVVVGEPISYTLIVQYSGRQSFDRPTPPDWGGLTVRGGASMQIEFNSAISGLTQSWEWNLEAAREGTHTIGPATIVSDGRTYETKPLTVTVRAAPAGGNLPAQLSGYIMPVQTGDPSLDEQLRNRLFLRATVSNAHPFVGEPVVIAYTLYNDGLPTAQSMQESVTDIPGAISEKLYETSRINYENVTVAGRDFLAATMYKVAVVPNKPGELVVQAYGMSGALLNNRRGRRGRADEFLGQPFPISPFFNNSVAFKLPAPPIRLDVRPLPPVGRPDNFSGTVGDYALEVAADREIMSEDDLLTLDLKLSGHGKIELAGAPDLPDNPDFERIGQTVDSQRDNDPDMIGGTKHFQWVLRPKRAGALHVPAIRYAIFDPFRDQYRELESPPMSVSVMPGATGMARRSEQLSHGSGERTLSPVYDLNYLKSIEALGGARSVPLFVRPAFWIVQLAGLGLFALALRRDRRQASMAPADQRRREGWSRFERRMRAVRRRSQSEPASSFDAAGELENIVRALIADRFNVSADGLTRQEIERLLLECAMPTERVERLCNLLEACAAVRFAPAGALNGRASEWIDEFGRLLKEGLYP